MTEQEFLASTDPQAMLNAVGGTDSDHPDRTFYGQAPYCISNRKLRLFACACCRSVFHQLTNERSRKAVEIAELYADGLATEQERSQLYLSLPQAGDPNFTSHGFQLVTNLLAPRGWRQESVLGELLNNTIEVCPECDGDGELTTSHRFTCYRCHGSGRVCGEGKGLLPYPQQAAILRDFIGNPWKPIVDERAYLTDVATRARVNAAAHNVRESAGLRGRDGDELYRRTVDSMVIRRSWLTPTVRELVEAAYREQLDRKCERCGGSGRIYPHMMPRNLAERCPNCHSTGTITTGQLDPDRLAVLSDALEEADCSNEDLLMALRGMKRCQACQGSGTVYIPRGEPSQGKDAWPCNDCVGGWVKSTTPKYRGFWATDLLLGRE